MNSVEYLKQKINRLQRIIDRNNKQLFVIRLRLASLALLCVSMIFILLIILGVCNWFLLVCSILLLSLSEATIFVVKIHNTALSDLIMQLLNKKIDEEGIAYLSDMKSEWINSGEPKDKIKKKELVFILNHYWGRFISWMRIPRFFSSIKIR
jgi:hypothetical protein